MHELTDETFEAAVQDDNGGPSVVKVWAPWCGPCKQIAPKVEYMATEYVGKAMFFGLNVDENKDTAREYGVQSIPTFLVFDADGELATTVVGSDLDEMREALDAVID